ncbi:LysO family transporter [Pyrobaculum sp. 3827-6]|uniref:lysine exporter LysO family protein n=1 Tax=Pyrobaculum sp. 3827-6 TaxID=2983604 RepID=UPI0021D97417|nr:LysO family transporter [Pyrobaculum sp. 3827-6]MCU7788287.1 LysO family transporter [Pyrobaculum sp. 3827-6]
MLYVSLVKYLGAIAAGYALGKALRRRPPPWLFTAVVTVLVFFVAANASEVVLRNVGGFLFVSSIYALALVLASATLGSALDRGGAASSAQRPAITLYVVFALAAGFAAGSVAKLDYSSAVDPLLIVLLLAAGADMAGVGVRFEISMLAAPAISLAATAVVAPLFTLLFNITPAVAFGMGWYSFTGPYLAAAGDAAGGAYGLLVNFLREQLTFVLAPLLARRFGKVGVLAMGGATTMDNTLPLYTALYGSSFSIYAFANGVVLTVLVPIIVPLIHQIYTNIV